MKTRRCAVCGKVKNVSEFGNGIRIPKTTCLVCKTKVLTFTEVKTTMFVKRIVKGTE
jgi:hypothetical protein